MSRCETVFQEYKVALVKGILGCTNAILGLDFGDYYFNVFAQYVSLYVLAFRCLYTVFQIGFASLLSMATPIHM